jgi:hypothetical protein
MQVLSFDVPEGSKESSLPSDLNFDCDAGSRFHVFVAKPHTTSQALMRPRTFSFQSPIMWALTEKSAMPKGVASCLDWPTNRSCKRASLS